MKNKLFGEKEFQQYIAAATQWTTEMEQKAVQSGEPLTAKEKQIAVAMGVKFPDKVRVDRDFSPPADPVLRAMLERIDMLEDPLGMTFNYGVFIKSGNEDNMTLLAHELRHVKQYEDFGSIENFISTYAEQLNDYGYTNSGIEQDARAKSEALSSKS